MRHPKNFVYSLCTAFLLLSCGSYQVEADEDSTSNGNGQPSEHVLSLRIESEQNAKINYPLSLFIFNSGDECVLRKDLTQTDEDYSVSLPAGQYSIAVLSGLTGNGLSHPLQFTPHSYIYYTDALHAPTPLQHGKVSVSLNRNTTAHVSLAYLVSAMRFSLNGIPSEAEAVEVKVSPVSSAVTFDGDFKNDAREVAIACHKEGLRWVSQETYVFPSTSTQTRLSINVSLPEKNEAYGYTYPAMLKPGTPYHFEGRYADAIALDGNYKSNGWQQVTETEFGFDDISTDTPTNPDPSQPGTGEEGNTTITVTRLPDVGELWKECLVSHVNNRSATQCEAVIVANDFMLSTASGLQAYLNDFQFNGLAEWRTFTTDEAASFRDAHYGTNGISTLNDFLLRNDVSPFKHETGDRYFCNGGASSFCFTSQTISATGEKKSYYIRPVKTVIFSVN